MKKKCVSKLENQSEQKPDDKIEPKFHKGEWIVHHGTGNIYQVVAVIGNQYQLKYGDNYTVQKCADVDRCARLLDNWLMYFINVFLYLIITYVCISLVISILIVCLNLLKI